jgi:hypothetical protein
MATITSTPSSGIKAIQVALLMPAWIVWSLAGPVTYILCVVDTWHGHSSVLVKLLINITLDGICAVVWPVTWIFWLIQIAAGHLQSTPLGLL